MLSKEQALNEDRFHTNNDSDSRGNCRVWRRNGKTKVWKTRPDNFRIPVKYGMYWYGYIDEVDAMYFHVESECIRKEVGDW